MYNTGDYGDENLKSLASPLKPSSVDTVAQLDEACRHLEKLINDVGAYLDWWDLRVVDLTSIKTFALLTIENDNAKRTVVDMWQKINNEFTNYKQQVDVCS